MLGRSSRGCRPGLVNEAHGVAPAMRVYEQELFLKYRDQGRVGDFLRRGIYEPKIGPPRGSEMIIINIIIVISIIVMFILHMRSSQGSEARANLERQSVAETRNNGQTRRNLKVKGKPGPASRQSANQPAG